MRGPDHPVAACNRKQVPKFPYGVVWRMEADGFVYHVQCLGGLFGRCCWSEQWHLDRAAALGKAPS